MPVRVAPPLFLSRGHPRDGPPVSWFYFRLVTLRGEKQKSFSWDKNSCFNWMNLSCLHFTRGLFSVFKISIFIGSWGVGGIYPACEAPCVIEVCLVSRMASRRFGRCGAAGGKVPGGGSLHGCHSHAGPPGAGLQGGLR